MIEIFRGNETVRFLETGTVDPFSSIFLLFNSPLLIDDEGASATSGTMEIFAIQGK